MEASRLPAPVAGEIKGDEAAVAVESKADEVVSRFRATVEDAESVGLPLIKVASDGKRMHLVSPQFIKELSSQPRFRPPPRLSNERLLNFVRGDQAKYAIMMKGYEAVDKVLNMETDILKQYHDKGYAYFVISDGAADDVPEGSVSSKL